MTSCPQCGTSYPDTVRLCPKDGTVLETPVPTHERMIGVVLDDKYRLDSFLSSGGMGAVFRATHVMLGKPVAVKLIKGDLVTSPETARRFQREARAATSLAHPSIVAVYDLGQTKDGTLYIAMELVDGRSLKDEIRQNGRIEGLRAQRLLRQVAGGLALAHRHQIVHRDLKPQNVMLTRDSDGRELAKLLDFGIAKTFDDAQTQLTAAGFALGTPHYMSPEQAMGKDVDKRSDIYSLGVVMYEMLVGEVPFNAPSTSGILVKHMTEPATPPSTRRPDIAIPAHLEAIVLRCLEKEPENRFQTADDLAAALETDMIAEAPRTAAAVSLDATTVLVSTPQAGVPLAPSGPTGVTHTAPAATAGQAPSATAATMAQPAATVGQTSPTMPAAAAQAMPVAKPGGSLGLLGVIAAVIVGIAALGGALWLIAGRDASTPDQTMASAEPVAPPATPASALPPDDAATAAAEPPAATASGAHTENPLASAGAGEVAASAGAATPATGPATSPAATGSSAPSGTTAGRSNAAPASTPRPSPGAPVNAAGPAAAVPAAAASAQPAVAQPAPPAPVPASLPADPSVFIECRGASEVCGAVRAAFDQTLQRERLPIARSADRADIVLVATVTLIDERREQQFGQTMAVRTYSIEVLGDAPRMDSVVPMPSPRTFSFDQRVGAERANENARVVAIDAVRRIRDFQKR